MTMDTIENVSLSIRRTLAAPVDRVFHAWTDPAALRHWFASGETYECLIAETDLRVGGRYRLGMRSPDGEENYVGGEYREIDPDRRLVFTWAWESTPERESRVTVEVRPEGDGTLLVLTHERFADEAIRDLHHKGWTGCLDMLTRFLEAPA